MQPLTSTIPGAMLVPRKSIAGEQHGAEDGRLRGATHPINYRNDPVPLMKTGFSVLRIHDTKDNCCASGWVGNRVCQTIAR